VKRFDAPWRILGEAQIAASTAEPRALHRSPGALPFRRSRRGLHGPQRALFSPEGGREPARSSMSYERARLTARKARGGANVNRPTFRA